MNLLRRASFAFAMILCTSVVRADPVLALVTSADGEGAAAVVRLSLTNRSTRPISLYRNSLPWVDRPGAFVMRAFLVEAELTPIPMKGRIHDPLGTLTLGAGETLTGSFVVADRIAEYEKNAAVGPIVLLWVYKPRSPDDVHMDVMTGSLLLSSGLKQRM